MQGKPKRQKTSSDSRHTPQPQSQHAHMDACNDGTAALTPTQHSNVAAALSRLVVSSWICVPGWLGNAAFEQRLCHHGLSQCSRQACTAALGSAQTAAVACGMHLHPRHVAGQLLGVLLEGVADELGRDWHLQVWSCPVGHALSCTDVSCCRADSLLVVL